MWKRRKSTLICTFRYFEIVSLFKLYRLNFETASSPRKDQYWCADVWVYHVVYGNLLRSWVPDVLSGDPIITSSGLVYPGLCCIQGWCILELAMRMRIMRFHADMRLYAVAIFRMYAYIFNIGRFFYAVSCGYAHINPHKLQLHMRIWKTTTWPALVYTPGCEDEQCERKEGRLTDSGNH